MAVVTEGSGERDESGGDELGRDIGCRLLVREFRRGAMVSDVLTLHSLSQFRCQAPAAPVAC